MDSQLNFLTKTSVRISDIITYNNMLVVEKYSLMRDVLISRLGRDEASIFAEPVISKRSETVEIAWYSEAIGTPVSLSALDDEAQAVVAEKLRRRLASLASLLSDPGIGPVLSRALYLADENSVCAVGREPILIGWGSMINWRLADRQSQERIFAATLGKYSSFDAPSWEVNVDVSKTIGKRYTDPLITRSPRFFPKLNGVYIGIGVASVILLLLTLPDVLRLMSQGGAVDSDALATQREITKAMASKVAMARAALADAHCDEGGILHPSGDGQHGEANPLPPSVGVVKPVPKAEEPADPNNGKPTAVKSGLALVAERASESVVFVFTCGSKATWEEETKDEPERGKPQVCPGLASDNNLVALASGSGFFINPTTIVTNSHVVDGAKAVFVTNKNLGKIQSANVIAKTAVQRGEPDFAALNVVLDKPPSSLALSTNVKALQNVVAAGYPGIILDEDPGEQKLYNGDPTATPELTTFPGFVTVLMNSEGELPSIFSSAVVGHGNSGGPLLDLCARATGINTLGWSGEKEDVGYKVNVALGSKGLVHFLDLNHINYVRSDEDCGDVVPASEAPPLIGATPATQSPTEAPVPGPLVVPKTENQTTTPVVK